MRTRQGILFIALLWAGAAAPVVAGSRGLVAPGQSAYVAAVEVVQGDARAPAGFADGLRTAVTAEAALYGAVGQAVVLRITIDKVHLKNAVASMIIGDDNQAAGHVDAVDQATGQPLGSFKVKVNAERHREASIAMAIVGAVDPTGYVDVASMVAGAGSAAFDHSGTEAAMGLNFAAATLRQTFGDAAAKAAHAKRP